MHRPVPFKHKGKKKKKKVFIAGQQKCNFYKKINKNCNLYPQLLIIFSCGHNIAKEKTVAPPVK